MRITIDVDFRKFYQSGVSSMSVDGFHKLVCHLETYALVLIAKIFGGYFGNIVAEIKNDGDFRKAFELFQHFAFDEHKATLDLNERSMILILYSY